MSQPPYPHPGPPLGYAPAPPQRPAGTNVMAVLAVVFAFVFSPLGIVFGVVGSRQTRRTGQSGRGLATTGLVLSVVFLLLGVAATVYLTVLAGSFLRSVPTTGVLGVSAPAVSGPVGPGTVAVADGDYGPELPADALAAEVGARTGASDVICPGYLPAQVEASSTCDGQLDGASARFRATVTGVGGSEATVDIAREE